MGVDVDRSDAKKRVVAPDNGATPAKKTRKSPEDSGTKPARQQEEPVKPTPPPDAFTLFSKSKWSVLEGESKDRLEQAKLMWKVFIVVLGLSGTIWAWR